MPSPPIRPRRLAPTTPVRREPPRPRWSRWLLVILMLGLLAILRVSSQARLSELDWESRHQDRLMVGENMRCGELLRARARLTAHARLADIAMHEGLVPPLSVKPIRVGALPAPKVYWELPDETGPSGILAGQRVGAAPPPPAATNRSLQ